MSKPSDLEPVPMERLPGPWKPVGIFAAVVIGGGAAVMLLSASTHPVMGSTRAHQLQLQQRQQIMQQDMTNLQLPPEPTTDDVTD